MKDIFFDQELKVLSDAGKNFLDVCENEIMEYMMKEEVSPEDNLMREIILELMDHIRGILRIEELRHKKIVKSGLLSRNEKDEIMLNQEVLPLMTELEVLIYDELKEQEIWTRTFVGYIERPYLVGLGKYRDLTDVPARIRG